MHQNKQQSTIYTNSLSRHASLLLSATPTIINSPYKASNNITSNIINTGASDSSVGEAEGESSNATTNSGNTSGEASISIGNGNNPRSTIINIHTNSINRNTSNMSFDATATDNLPSSSTPLCASSPRRQQQQQKVLLNNHPPLLHKQSNSSSLLQQPQVSLQQRRHANLGPLSTSSQQQLLGSNSTINLDAVFTNNNPSNATNPHNNQSTVSIINLNKSHGLIIKKLDGIQKIVAAHSNYNKLYALNDFSGLGVGPKRPFELPPKLPPPPPWVPKVSSSGYNVSQWAQDSFGDRAYKKKFQENLIALLKQEIAAVAKSANLKFNSPPANRSRPVEQSSFNLKSSPQTLFNTIRRETSLLLSRREKASNQSTSTNSRIQHGGPLLNRDSSSRQPYKIINRQATASHDALKLVNTFRQPVYQLQQTVKVVIPPTEYYQNPTSQSRLSHEKKEESENLIESGGSNDLTSKRSSLTYQVIRKKLKAFQDNNQIYLGFSLFSSSMNGSNSQLIGKKLPQKSLDKIVDRLKARCSGAISKSQPQSRSNSISLQQRIINSSADLLRVATGGRQPMGPVSAPTPIPVFRSSLSGNQRGDWFNRASLDSRVVKSKKSKRHPSFGLKIANFIERELPQPNKDQITVDQFAKCLNLVRANDISVRRHREQLESEVKWRLPVSNRPLRLRRIRGERMPPSASYKATRKAGLQYNK